jgi:hypothetical protein
MQIPMRATVRQRGRSAHLPTEAANSMRACSDTYLSTDVPTDFENLEGFSNFSGKFKKYQRTLPTEFNATAQENIILCSVGNIAV